MYSEVETNVPGLEDLVSTFFKQQKRLVCRKCKFVKGFGI
jgi:hypothetical protein